MRQPVSMIFRARLFETTTTFKKRGSTPSCFLQMSFLQLTFSETIVKYSLYLLDIKNYNHLPWPSSRHPPKESRGQDRGPRVPHLGRLRRRFHDRHQGLGGGAAAAERGVCPLDGGREPRGGQGASIREKAGTLWESWEPSFRKKNGEKTKEGMFCFGGEKGREEMMCISVSTRC